MHSVGLSEDWQQIKEEVGLGAMECWSTGVLDAKLTWSFKLIYHYSITPLLLLDLSIFA
jgi:hypothetical protein